MGEGRSGAFGRGGLELEGIVSKRVDGRYQSGRNDLWRRSTCRHRETFVAVGWAAKAGRFDGIYLGREERGKLRYAGKLERGFTDADKKRILQMFERLKSKEQPITAPCKFPKANWVKPRVLVDAGVSCPDGRDLMD
jgi:bifunctional non-homologous end joining protein LigD